MASGHPRGEREQAVCWMGLEVRKEVWVAHTHLGISSIEMVLEIMIPKELM